MNLLMSIKTIMNPVPAKILILYQRHQDIYANTKRMLAAEGINVEMREGCEISLKEAEVEASGKQMLIFIDDAGDKVCRSQAISDIVTTGRHSSITIMLSYHQLFPNNPVARMIAANASYFWLLPSPMLAHSIRILDTQLQFKGAISSAFEQVCDESLFTDRYLLVDLCSDTNKRLRLRSQITKEIQIAFIPS